MACEECERLKVRIESITDMWHRRAERYDEVAKERDILGARLVTLTRRIAVIAQDCDENSCRASAGLWTALAVTEEIGTDDDFQEWSSIAARYLASRADPDSEGKKG